MISNTCRYGIRAVIYIASQPKPETNTGLKKIAKDLNIPNPFLAKILQQLARHKILYSTKGPHGGFSMLKDPRQISLLDIIEIIDGKDFFENCIIHNKKCQYFDKKKIPCPLHEDYDELRLGLVKLFTNETIYNLAKKAGDRGKIII